MTRHKIRKESDGKMAGSTGMTGKYSRAENETVNKGTEEEGMKKKLKGSSEWR